MNSKELKQTVPAECIRRLIAQVFTAEPGKMYLPHHGKRTFIYLDNYKFKSSSAFTGSYFLRYRTDIAAFTGEEMHKLI